MSNFKLYPTQNHWNFLKLDTRTGQIWQVQFSVDEEEGYCHETVLNEEDLSFGTCENPGRFQLYPTSNIWNFILLDREDGRTWQVQWQLGRLHRFVSRIKSVPLPFEIGDVFTCGGVEVKIVENLGGGYYRITPATEIKRKSWDEANDYCAALGDGWRLPTYEEYLVLAKGKSARFWTSEVDPDNGTVFFYDPNNPNNAYKRYTTDKSLKFKIIPIVDVYLH